MRAGQDEGPDQVADHVVEETVGGDAVEEEVVGGAPLGVGDGADGGVGRVGVKGCQGGSRGARITHPIR